MKTLTSIILILFLSLLSSPSWSESLTMDDLVERNDLYYREFTDVPFTGEVSGKGNGKIKKGKKEDLWKTCHYDYPEDYPEDDIFSKHLSHGEIWKSIPEKCYFLTIDNWKGGKRNGSFELYHVGKLRSKGNYQSGFMDGLWEWYGVDKFVSRKNFKFGKLHGLSEMFYPNGQLFYRKNYKDGIEDGLWEYFDEDGSSYKTETWKNDVKQE